MKKIVAFEVEPQEAGVFKSLERENEVVLISDRLCNRMSGNSESACSRILAFPLDIGFRVGSPLVVDLDQHGADQSG
jgi:hypothetical protein